MVFCHFQESLEKNMVLMDAATIIGIYPEKTAHKRVVQKPAEPTRDLIRDKIAKKITSVSKTKNKEKED